MKSSNIGAARIVKEIEGIKNFDMSSPITTKENIYTIILQMEPSFSLAHSGHNDVW